MSDHWSEYWSQGRITSLPQDFAANYDGEVAQFWNRQFESVPDGGCVVDLCSGNGAVALLAARHFLQTGRNAVVMAVDAAQSDTAALLEQFPAEADAVQRVRFRPATRVEDLDLEDQCIDLATSQYGIEYCDWEPAAAQVARILKPGGRFVMVCHNPASEIIAYMRSEHADYERLESAGFFTSSRGYLEREIDHQAVSAQYRVIAGELGPEFRRAGSPLLGSVLNLLQSALRMSNDQLADRRDALAHYLAQMEAGRDRLRDMLRVNEALNDTSRWPGVFEQAGLVLKHAGEIRYRGQHHAGGYHVFEKPLDG